MIRLQGVAITNDGVQIAYVQEADIHTDSGIMESRTIDIPHESLPQALLEDLIDSAMQIIDHARVVRRNPTDEYRVS